MKGFVHCLGIVLLLLPASTVSHSAAAQDSADPLPKAEYYKLMKEFATIFNQIDRNYVKDMDRRELLEAAIKGMMQKLDPYSSYIAPKDLNRFNESVEQRFGGIGVQVRVDPVTKRLTVTTPLPGTPAYKAGIRPGDTIMEVEKKSTKGFSIDDAVKLLKGKPGEAVNIGIRHAGSQKTVQIRLVRAIIEVATVQGDHYNADGTWNFMADPKKKIGYIRLTHFSRRSDHEMQAALQQLKKQGFKSLIIDLRFNPGGLLSQAIAIADLFIEKGRIVSTKGKNTRERVWNATKAGTYTGFPMAVLVNRYSASASEILSACLQDHKRAVIIGERTWGKGSVQNVIQIPGAASALKLTTASYHRPSGKNIHRFPNAKDSDEWGVIPRKEDRIRFTFPEMQKYLDYRRKRDVLSKTGPPKSDFKDRQLARAISHVTGTAHKKPANAVKPKARAAKAAVSARRPDNRRSALPLNVPLLRVPRTKAA
ncbi:MAG: S41 family peptidase [Planctomycetaceae bacterium]